MNIVRDVAVQYDVILLDFNLEWLAMNNNNKLSTQYLYHEVNGSVNATQLHPDKEGFMLWGKFILKNLDLLDPTSAFATMAETDIALKKQVQDINQIICLLV